MANKKISQLTGATVPLIGTEELAIVQSGQTVKVTAQDVADLAGAPYLVYSALLNQSGTSAPIVTVLENTLGENISYDVLLAGQFSASKLTNFNLSKTAVFFSPNSQAGIATGNAATNFDGSSITIRYADGGAFLLARASFEIRIYP